MRTGAAVPCPGAAVAELAPLVVPPGPQLVARVRAGVVPEQQAVHVADGEVVPRPGPGAVGVLHGGRRERDAQVAPVPEGAVLHQGHGAQAVAVGDALPGCRTAHLDRDSARHEVALAEAAEGVAAPGPERAVAPDRIGLPVGRRRRACRCGRARAAGAARRARAPGWRRAQFVDAATRTLRLPSVVHVHRVLSSGDPGSPPAAIWPDRLCTGTSSESPRRREPAEAGLEPVARGGDGDGVALGREQLRT